MNQTDYVWSLNKPVKTKDYWTGEQGRSPWTTPLPSPPQSSKDLLDVFKGSLKMTKVLKKLEYYAERGDYKYLLLINSLSLYG